MSDSRFENKSCDCRQLPNFPELITAKDACKLVKKTLGTDAEVVDYAMRSYSEEKIGFLGSHQLLVITVRCKDDENSRRHSTVRFFVKAMPYDVPTQAEYVRDMGVFQQEAYFFDNVVPELTRDFKSEPWAPECYLIKNDCLVFEELRACGFRMSEKLLDDIEIRAGLGALARLHGASLHAEARLGCPLNKIYPDAFEERAFLHRGNQYRWYLAGIDVAVRIAESLGLDATKIRDACDRVFDAVKPSIVKQNVASHGDLWSNNLMFDESNPPRCRLVDFQLARYSPIGHDIAQFLYLCGSREFREKHGAAMLRHYYDCLSDCLEVSTMNIPVKVPSWREIELGYEEQRLGALVTAVIYFPTVLLDGIVGATIMNNPVTYEKFVLHDRRDMVVGNMQRDPEYRRRLVETVRELVEMSQKLDELPKPC